MNEWTLTFFGVRGSYPISTVDTIGYGGNTSAVLVANSREIVILDAGTGLINMGTFLAKHKPENRKIDIFITHLHIDHILGLPFFEPFFDSEFTVTIHGCRDGSISFKDTIYSLFNHPFSPISTKGIKANVDIHEIDGKEQTHIPLSSRLSVDLRRDASHPLHGVSLFRLNVPAGRIIYATDIESPDGFTENTADFVRGCDILIHDSQYFDNEYYSKNQPKKGFGHSTVTMAAENAARCDVKKLFLFHYNPDHSDQHLETMQSVAQKKFKATYLAKEHQKVELRR